MRPKLTRRTAQKIIRQIENEGSSEIKEILQFHIYQNDLCLTRYAIVLNNEYQTIICSMEDLQDLQHNYHIVPIGSFSFLQEEMEEK